MRKIIAGAHRFEAFNGAVAAIQQSKDLDRLRRTVSDEHIRGKRIHNAQWTDSALAIGLDDGQFLNVVATADGLNCAIESDSRIVSSQEADPTILELEKSILEWRRSDIAGRYLNGLLHRLWFGDNSILIHVNDKPILACHRLELLPTGNPLLFWCESE